MSKKWRYKLADPFMFRSPYLEGVSFHNDWLDIEEGIMMIRAQYAWDGCTPAYCIIDGGENSDGFWIGIWDGPVGPDGKRATWMATVVHDALCQFREEIHGLTKEKTIAIFKSLLKQNNCPCCIVTLYPKAVDLFGPQEWQ